MPACCHWIYGGHRGRAVWLSLLSFLSPRPVVSGHRDIIARFFAKRKGPRTILRNRGTMRSMDNQQPLKRGRPRRSNVDEKQVCADYVDETLTVASILERHGLHSGLLYKILLSNGINLRTNQEDAA